ncbi:pentapeptide repeat-containing protein [Nonomuraea endophytica]|uniref:Pentapeptide repeat-containing protein n=1 Tax=Nonomuraea endophytica TaxID=714136 RepID=A0A7W7ZXK9_9ACTN|nr:pentapeptide repeat-containing protein [Nonomuraea endophytica]MBB5075644.1 hypothetical protein [Nonomuraea endophytica]
MIKPVRRRWLIPLVAAIACVGWAATNASIPVWGRWVLTGIFLAGTTGLGIGVLVGPAARRLAGESRPPTEDELRQMTVSERVEAVNAARHTLIQAATGLVVIGGVVFTGLSLWFTAQSLDASLQAQRTAEQSQITDRYTKAVEQLGSAKLDVRLGGLYALERLAQDSTRDHQTVYDVLAAFVHEHDPSVKVRDDDLPLRPATDVQAALTILGRRDTRQDKQGQGHYLKGIRAQGADLRRANLSKADLTEANLNGADLAEARLTNARLVDVRLSPAFLNGADLSGADMRSANLTGADLRTANLRGADLRRADMRGADLRGLPADVVKQIRAQARFDKDTRF